MAFSSSNVVGALLLLNWQLHCEEPRSHTPNVYQVDAHEPRFMGLAGQRLITSLVHPLSHLHACAIRLLYTLLRLLQEYSDSSTREAQTLEPDRFRMPSA